MSIDIKDLETFLAILDSGSISRAAEDIGLTQPALSLKLKKMETELGISLFQRTPRSVVPLETARIIEPKARDLLNRLDGLREALANGITELAGQVRIGCLTGWVEPLLVPTVASVRHKAPNLRLRLFVNQTVELIHMVTHGRLDLAIVAQPFERTDGIELEQILDEELVLVGKKLPEGAPRAESLLTRTWVTLSVPDPLVSKWWREQFSEDFPWERAIVPVTVDNIGTIPPLMRSIDDAVAVLPRQIIQPLCDSGEFQITHSIGQQNALYLIWRTEGLQLQRYRTIKEALVEQAKSLVARDYRSI